MFKTEKMYHDDVYPHSQTTVPSYTLWFLRYDQHKILKVKVTTARSKVKSKSHHDIDHLHPLTNVKIKYQIPTPYSFRDISQTRSKSLQLG